jgi:SAM-dependent methyltransferase
MLLHAQAKLGSHSGRYALLMRDAQDLPFPSDTFDAVSCLEALEFMPSPSRVLSEMARVLRPGGVFVVTNRVNWERKLMPGKAFTDDEIRALVRNVGLIDVEIRPWQVYYDLIWARKPGAPSRLGNGTQDLSKHLCCPQCENTPLKRNLDRLHCMHCSRDYPINGHIVEMA